MKLLKTTLILFFSLITLSSTIGQDIKIGDNFYFIADQGQLSSKFMQLFNGDSIDAETEINAKDIIKVTAIDADTIYFKYFLFDTTKKNKKTK